MFQELRARTNRLQNNEWRREMDASARQFNLGGNRPCHDKLFHCWAHLTQFLIRIGYKTPRRRGWGWHCYAKPRWHPGSTKNMYNTKSLCLNEWKCKGHRINFLFRVIMRHVVPSLPTPWRSSDRFLFLFTTAVDLTPYFLWKIDFQMTV